MESIELGIDDKSIVDLSNGGESSSDVIGSPLYFNANDSMN